MATDDIAAASARTILTELEAPEATEEATGVLVAVC